LTVSQVRTIVTTQMPLGAPGSLSSSQYAAVMAYILANDCVKATGDNQPFPATDQPAFSKITVGGQTCPVK